MPKGIIYNLLDYLELIDWTGRQIRENKTGSIDGNAPPILLRIGIAPEHWIERKRPPKTLYQSKRI